MEQRTEVNDKVVNISDFQKTTSVSTELKNGLITGQYTKTAGTLTLTNTETMQSSDSSVLLKQGGMRMNNGSFDTLFQELKADMREREERSRREISEREERFKEQLSSYAQEASKREERFTSLIQEIKSDMRESEKRISENIFNSEQRINTTEKRLQDTVTNLENTMRNIKNHNLAVNIALFVGMLAIVITLIIAVFV